MEGTAERAHPGDAGEQTQALGESDIGSVHILLPTSKLH